MKSLTCSSFSSCSTKIFHFCCSSSVRFHPASSHRLLSFPLTKLPSLHLISLQPIRLLPLSSSSSSDSQTNLELPETVDHENHESKTVHVKFQLKKECSFGEEFAIVGDDPDFGLWDPDNAIPLNWSADHVWNLELDVPIGKSIHFKFILKQISGSILWQPGPDRFLKTWDTQNTIVVWEDWEDATSQKLLEEEPISNENVDPAVNSDMKLVTGDFNAPNMKEEEQIGNVESNPEKEPLPSMAASEEKDISRSIEEPAANETQTHQILKEEDEVEPNNEAITSEKILENSGRTPEAEDSGRTNVEGNLMVEEGNPVLVPGLPVVPVEYNETESSSAFGASVGVNEVEKHILPEKQKPVNIQFKEKHVDQHKSEMIEAFNDMEQKLEANEEMNQKISNNVVEKDIQWGRQTIQRLLTNLGLL